MRNHQRLIHTLLTDAPHPGKLALTEVGVGQGSCLSVDCFKHQTQAGRAARCCLQANVKPKKAPRFFPPGISLDRNGLIPVTLRIEKQAIPMHLTNRE